MLRYLLFGVGTWLLPFAVGVALFPVVDQASALFDSLMSVAMSASAGGMSYLFLRNRSFTGARQGAFVGLGWAALAAMLDSPLFLFGPFRMAAADYFADIGLGYLMIPVIAACVGQALRHAEAAARGS